MEKKRNLWVLPTDKPSRLHTYKGVLNLAAGEFVAPTIVKNDLINLNIYITNDEEIKIDDWCIDKHNFVYKQETDKIFSEFTGSKKIILTTDIDLIKDGVQAIDDEFLEWFVNNPSRDEVELKKGFADGTAYGYNFLDYKIIIPKEVQCTCKEHDPYCCQIHGNCPTCVKKEEPKQENSEYFGLPKFGTKEFNDLVSGLFGGKPKLKEESKQETVEEAAEVYANKKGDIPTTKLEDAIFKQGFIDGAKSDAAKNYWFKIFRKEFITWMQERMYSEEEVNDLLEMLKRSIAEINHLKYTYKDKGHCGKYLFDCETIIENFKKK